MAIILVDTCVVTDLMNIESSGFEWSAATLEQLESSHVLAINPIIYAECSVGFETIEAIEQVIDYLGFKILQLSKEALFLAGKAFLCYRRHHQGSKINGLPDFFIGAQAAVEGWQLVTRDKARFSTYFPTLALITPG